MKNNGHFVLIGGLINCENFIYRWRFWNFVIIKYLGLQGFSYQFRCKIINLFIQR
jgi:hypothetical protein